jgi:hypothetical protein
MTQTYWCLMRGLQSSADLKNGGPRYSLHGSVTTESHPHQVQIATPKVLR